MCDAIISLLTQRRRRDNHAGNVLYMPTARKDLTGEPGMVDNNKRMIEAENSQPARKNRAGRLGSRRFGFDRSAQVIGLYL